MKYRSEVQIKLCQFVVAWMMKEEFHFMTNDQLRIQHEDILIDRRSYAHPQSYKRP